MATIDVSWWMCSTASSVFDRRRAARAVGHRAERRAAAARARAASSRARAAPPASRAAGTRTRTSGPRRAGRRSSAMGRPGYGQARATTRRKRRSPAEQHRRRNRAAPSSWPATPARPGGSKTSRTNASIAHPCGATWPTARMARAHALERPHAPAEHPAGRCRAAARRRSPARACGRAWPERVQRRRRPRRGSNSSATHGDRGRPSRRGRTRAPTASMRVACTRATTKAVTASAERRLAGRRRRGQHPPQ